MQRYFGVDVCDVWRGTLSLRRLRVLLMGLPADCRSVLAIGDVHDMPAGWSLVTMLLARAIDELAAHRWLYESAHVDKHKRRAPPESVMPKSVQRSNVVELVQPRELTRFVNDFEGSFPHGD